MKRQRSEEEEEKPNQTPNAYEVRVMRPRKKNAEAIRKQEENLTQ